MILITGSFGSVGTHVVQELLKRRMEIRTFDLETKRNTMQAARIKRRLEFDGQWYQCWGDIRDAAAVEEAVEGCDSIIHLAACIPPTADRNPELAFQINVEGTRNIIRAAEGQPKQPSLIFSSSIAVYGDRRVNPCISIDDPLCPGDDEYARQKIACEHMIRESTVPWTILRLTYIADVATLHLDPLMFSMPLETCIEICDVRDAALAIVNAEESLRTTGSSEDMADRGCLAGTILNIGGGHRCRTTYRDYLSRMFSLFGLGQKSLPPAAFSTHPFHCGFMDSVKSQRLLSYQNVSLEEFYTMIWKKHWLSSLFVTLVRPIARAIIVNSSPFYQTWKRKRMQHIQYEIRKWFLNST